MGPARSCLVVLAAVSGGSWAGAQTNDFVQEWCNATWRAGATTLTVNCPGDETTGHEVQKSGSTLSMKPHLSGSIRGTYPSVAISGTQGRFRAHVSLERDAYIPGDPIPVGTVGTRFQLCLERDEGYVLSEVTLDETHAVGVLAADLSIFDGTSIVLALRVESADPTARGVWSEARIVQVGTSEDPHERLYDFGAHLESTDALPASWESGAGALEFGGPEDDPEGWALVKSVTREDGESGTHLLMHPNSSGSEMFVAGTFREISLPVNANPIHFRAEVGFVQGSTAAEAVFRVFAVRAGEKIEVAAVQKEYDDSLAEISANLTGFQGSTIDLELRVSAHGSAVGDDALWIDPRVECLLPRQYFPDPSGADDRNPIRLALQSADLANPGEVLLRPLEYRLSAHIVLPDTLADVNLRGQGGTSFTMLDPTLGVLDIDHSRNVCVRGLTVDYEPLPFTQGSISSVTSSSFVFSKDLGYMGLGNSFWSTGFQFGVFHEALAPYRVPDNCTQATFITGFAGGTVQVTDTHGAANGHRFSYVRRERPAFRARNFSHTYVPDTQVLFSDITIYSSPELCFVGVGVEKLFVRNCTVAIKPGSGRIQSANGDGVHVQNCRFGPDVIDCHFSGMVDDGVNVYAMAYGLVSTEYLSNELLIDTQGRAIEVGDHLRVFRPSDGWVGPNLEVLTHHVVQPIGYSQPLHGVTVSPSFATSDPGAYQLFDEDFSGRGFLVSGCTFQDFRGRGVIAKTSEGAIRGNTFLGLSGAAIELVNSPYFGGEGLQVKDVRIEDNTLDHCGFNYYAVLSGQSGIIRIGLIDQTGAPSASAVHDGIVIHDNRLYNWPRHALFVGNTSGVTVTDNLLENYSGDGTKSSSGLRGIFFFDRCQDVSVLDNIVHDWRASTLIDGRIFAKDSGTITIGGNIYSPTIAGDEVTVVTGY